MIHLKNVMLGMSGGVDSSAAAILLADSGIAVTGATLWLHGAPSSDTEDARAVCERLGITHHVFDLRERFADTVIADFIAEYRAGRTPNPCIACNRHIKFSEMLTLAVQNGCDGIATGHYARIASENGRYLLTRPADRNKDQTYVLYCLTQEQLSHTLFPLGELTKEQARALAEECGLVNARKRDSQDICFVPDGDYAGFIGRYTGITFPHGEFTDRSGNPLGEHQGIIHYTVGQRKGLGIALGKPAFVLEKDAAANRVILDTDESLLFRRRVTVTQVNFIPFDTLSSPLRVTAKLRYRHAEQPATLHPLGDDTVMLEFDEAQRAPSPGQAAVFYDGDTVIGGGTIAESI